MAPLKIIGAGYGRTGTDSLRMALNMLGYNCFHMRELIREDRHPEVFLDAYLNPEKPVDWDKLYDGYDAAVDWPTVSFVERLLTVYPDAKVILTARDVDSWYRSIKNTIHKLSVECSKRNDLSEPLQRWREMNNTLVLDGAIGDPERFNDEEAIKAKYNAHVEWIKKNVPSEQLFIMELGEGWERLCKFLDVPVPSDPYPSANSTKDFVKSFIESNLQDV
ncbi:hypothetical protein O0I10_002122 [Lichtheimia ornata]|uniref:P-loop containing nucleoside triphosphate hydrolase protein n=1 Tax=Lichtheimia ornata TaxID=688661 RepID=A0AAD7VBZ5_9FUNG|nr:uncharacterized protein O0I10_002122 [Lichtheimia ornata]KAJ8662428.1 hypothetical protein O0I10_002122 [Lichtheimia ornata]